jgi:hypothetical protein
MTKDQFLTKYNQTRTTKEALSKSIRAAVQHNKIYVNVQKNDRIYIRNYWSDLLIKLSEQFKEENWDELNYEVQIIKLKNVMNAKFEHLIDFRISHSQKSIGVFFKHLWCLDILPTPPQCPVDRIILTKANAPINERSWGHVNDIETHKNKYEIIRQQSIRDGFNNVSIWELDNFG